MTVILTITVIVVRPPLLLPFFSNYPPPPPLSSSPIFLLSFPQNMESLLLLGPPFKEALFLIPHSVGSTPPRSHTPPPPYLSPSPLLSSGPLGTADERLLGVYYFYDGVVAITHCLPSPPLPPPPPPWLSSLLLMNQRGGAPGEENYGQSRTLEKYERLWRIERQQRRLWQQPAKKLITTFSTRPPPRVRGKIEALMRGVAGGWEQWWKRGKELSCRGKIADYFSEGDNKEPFDVKSKETGRLRREEGGAVGVRPPSGCQPQIPIGAHESEGIPEKPFARHSWCIPNQERHQIEGCRMTGTGRVSTICEGKKEGEWTRENISARCEGKTSSCGARGRQKMVRREINLAGDKW